MGKTRPKLHLEIIVESLTQKNNIYYNSTLSSSHSTFINSMKIYRFLRNWKGINTEAHKVLSSFNSQNENTKIILLVLVFKMKLYILIKFHITHIAFPLHTTTRNVGYATFSAIFCISKELCNVAVFNWLAMQIAWWI